MQVVGTELESYLHHYKLGWAGDGPYECVQDGEYLVRNFDRGSENKWDPRNKWQWF